MDIRPALREQMKYQQMQQRKQIFFDYMTSCIEAGCTPEQAWSAYHKKNSYGLSKIMCGFWTVVFVLMSCQEPFLLVGLGVLPLIWIMFQERETNMEEHKFYSEYLTDRWLNG